MSKMTKTIAALGVVAGLGVAALPLSSYAAVVTDSTDVTLNAVVGEAISVTTNAADDTVTINNVTANQDAKEGSTVLTIQTNNANGYTLTIEDADATTALKDASNTSYAGIATLKSGATLDKGTTGWGFKASTTTDGVTANLTNWTGIKTTAQTLATRASGATATDGDQVTLTFGVVVDSTVPAGTYSDVVTLTATTNS